MNQLFPVHTPISHFLKIHLNIIFPSVPGCPQWSLSLRLPHQNSVHISPLPHTRYMAHPYNFFFYFVTRTILGEQDRSLSSSICSFLHSPITSSLLDPNILLNTLFSNTLSLHDFFKYSMKHLLNGLGKISFSKC